MARWVSQMGGLLAVALTAVVAFVFASGAEAALVIRDDVDSADVTFTADPGEANRVVVREELGGFRFVDAGSVLKTTTCTQVNAHEVFCPGIAETLIVEVGDGDDFVDVSGPRSRSSTAARATTSSSRPTGLAAGGRRPARDRRRGPAAWWAG